MKRIEFAGRSSQGHSEKPPPKRIAPWNPNFYSTTTIGSLPGEVLVRIFHALPWRDRVLGVEAVCKLWRELMRTRGWADVRHFNHRDLPLHWFGQGQICNCYGKRRIGPLLDRVGLNLRSLYLCFGMDQANLRAQLGKCPQLQHLGIRLNTIELATIEHIESAYANSLKSLHLFSYRWETSEVRALNEALPHFAALECLQLSEEFDNNLSRDLCLPPADSMVNLRHVVLRNFWNQTLREENIEVLASLSALRSLSLNGLDSKRDLSFLQRFPLLEHLSVSRIGTDNLRSFIEALPHMAGSLRALEVEVGYFLRSNEGLMAGIAANLTRLEHLGLESFASPEVCDLFAGMKDLRSLRLNNEPYLRQPHYWHWLCGMTRLEHLELTPAPPSATLCNLVKNCKSLRSMRLDDYRPSIEEQVALAVAAKETNLQGAAALPPVNVRVDFLRSICDEWIKLDSRLRITAGGKLSSPVLDTYKYGQLSGGKPDFAY